MEDSETPRYSEYEVALARIKLGNSDDLAAVSKVINDSLRRLDPKSEEYALTCYGFLLSFRGKIDNATVKELYRRILDEKNKKGLVHRVDTTLMLMKTDIHRHVTTESSGTYFSIVTTGNRLADIIMTHEMSNFVSRLAVESKRGMLCSVDDTDNIVIDINDVQLM